MAWLTPRFWMTEWWLTDRDRKDKGMITFLFSMQIYSIGFCWISSMCQHCAKYWGCSREQGRGGQKWGSNKYLCTLYLCIVQWTTRVSLGLAFLKGGKVTIFVSHPLSWYHNMVISEKVLSSQSWGSISGYCSQLIALYARFPGNFLIDLYLCSLHIASRLMSNASNLAALFSLSTFY